MIVHRLRLLATFCGDSDEGDQDSGLMVISVPGSMWSVVGAKRRWRLDFPQVITIVKLVVVAADLKNWIHKRHHKESEPGKVEARIVG